MEEISFCKQAFEAFRTEIMIVLFGWELRDGKDGLYILYIVYDIAIAKRRHRIEESLQIFGRISS